jgi:hypothetical protein
MKDALKHWLFDLTVSKPIATAMCLIMDYTIVRSLQRAIGHYVSFPRHALSHPKICDFFQVCHHFPRSDGGP